MLLFLAAGITDGLDGYIAKRFNYRSKLGAILDPLADKLLIACAYVMLAILGNIPVHLLVTVMFRDLIIVVGYLLLVMIDIKVPMRPTYLSKVNTFLQIALVVVVLASAAHLVVAAWVVEILVYSVLITTVASGLQYVWAWGIKAALGEAPPQ